MSVFLTIMAIVVSLYSIEDFFRKSWKSDNAKERLDQIATLLFAIFLLLLAAIIKYVW
jgi:hypothetical protein